MATIKKKIPANITVGLKDCPLDRRRLKGLERLGKRNNLRALSETARACFDYCIKNEVMF